jgi:NosR/NirI family nitrous oxide reductase transcriptional regulator
MIPGFSRWIGLRDGPALDRDRESTRKGVFVVGDLADAPILKAALLQGDETGRHVAHELGEPGGAVDVAIVGAGPAGIAAAAALRDAGFSAVVLERDAPFHTIDAFPAGKVMYADPHGVAVPAILPFEDQPKDDLVAGWRARVAASGLDVRQAEVLGIDGTDGNFTVRTSTGPISARKVILALGRRGTPRKLAIPGGDRALDRLDDPAAWAGRRTEAAATAGERGGAWEIRPQGGFPSDGAPLARSEGAAAGNRILVIGGGDTAVETACSIAEAGGTVVLVHRGAKLDRPKPRNRARLAASAVTVRLSVAPTAIEPDRVVLSDGSKLPADAVYAMIGTELPRDWLAANGIGFRSDPWRELRRAPGILAFAAFVYAFYVLKQHRDTVPFAPALAWIGHAVEVPVAWWPGGPRTLDASFWGTLLYSLAIVGFGLDAMRRHRTPVQRRRYLSLIGFQAVFLFGIPEVVAPALTATPGKFYSLVVPWPLSIWSLAHEPAAWGWLVAGALVSFVGIPLYVWRYNESFCSTLCGCGGLAETLGDRWRDRAPRGDNARRAEWAGVLILLLAIPVTALILNDLWGLVGFHTWLDQTVTVHDGRVDVSPWTGAEDVGAMRIASATVDGDAVRLGVEKFDWDRAWHPTGWIREVRVGDSLVYPEKLAEGDYRMPIPSKPAEILASSSSLSRATDFAKSWYSLAVDFGLASLAGVALYPWLGNRVWCRFFCPLRAYMEFLAKRFGRLAIAANTKCISCGECVKACQMGIDVQGVAEHAGLLDNTNSACIQCGVCVEVCPMDVLSLVDVVATGQKPVPDAGPRWG